MGTAQLAFAGDRAGIITGSDVSHVTRRGPGRKYVLRMPGFPPASSSIILTGSDVRLTSPEGALSGSMFCACLVLFLFSYVVVQNVGWGCSLRRPRPIFSMVTGTNPGYLPPFIFI